MIEHIYVSLRGNDDNPGTKELPFRTPEAAREKTLVLKNSGFKGEIHVIFEGGVYEFKNTFEITEPYSGNDDVRIKYSGNGEDEVCFSGGITLLGCDFTGLGDEDAEKRIPDSLRDKILCLDLKKFTGDELEHQKRSGFAQDIIPSANELFVDNRAEQLGGFPKGNGRKQIKRIVRNQDFAKAESGAGDRGRVMGPDPYTDYGFTREDYAIIGYDFPEGDKWGRAKDAVLHYVEGYVDAMIPVDHIDTERKEIHCGELCWSKISNDNYTSSFRVFNLLEEVTTPGEYYIDREQGMLFYYPYEGFHADSKVQISYLKEPMVAVEDCRNIEFENITFENTRGMAVYSDHTEKLIIKNCVFRNIGMVAVSMGIGFEETKTIVHNASLRPKRRTIGGLKAHMWDHPMYNRQAGENNLIIGCEIYNIGCGGVIIDGGDRMDLSSGNTWVVDCDIHDFNRIDQTYRPGVRIFGVGNGVAFSKIHEAPQQAIEIMGNDITIAYNEIYHCCQDSYDNGAVYIGSWRFSVNSFHTNIFCNYFHQNGANDNKPLGLTGMRSETYDLYLDGHPGTNAYMNIFEGSNVSEAMFINADAMYNNLYNNVIADVSGLLIQVRSAGEYSFGEYRDRSYNPYRIFDLSEESEKIWKERYPEMENYKDMTLMPYLGHRFHGNLHLGKGHMIRGYSRFAEYRNNCHFNSTEYINDIKTSDYIFDEGSEIFEKCQEFQNIPVKYIANYARYKEERDEQECTIIK